MTFPCCHGVDFICSIQNESSKVKSRFLYLRSYQSKLKPIVLDHIPAEEKEAAAEVAKINFKTEVEWLLRVILKLCSPVVFSHNDINTGNILVR